MQLNPSRLDIQDTEGHTVYHMGFRRSGNPRSPRASENTKEIVSAENFKS